MMPFGEPTAEAIEERRANVSDTLFAFTTERIMTEPAQQQQMFFSSLIPQAREHLNALVADRRSCATRCRIRRSISMTWSRSPAASSSRYGSRRPTASPSPTASTRTANTASTCRDRAASKRSRSGSSLPPHPPRPNSRSRPSPAHNFPRQLLRTAYVPDWALLTIRARIAAYPRVYPRISGRFSRTCGSTMIRVYPAKRQFEKLDRADRTLGSHPGGRRFESA
jgi:hypothetical protein